MCQSLSPLWCPSLWECWWLLFSATFQEGPKNHHANPSSHANPATVHEVGTNKKMKGDAMEIDANTAYGSHVSSTVYDEVGNNKKMKEDAMEMNTNTAYGSHVS